MGKVSKGILLFTVFGLVFTSAVGCATQQKPESRQQANRTQPVRDQTGLRTAPGTPTPPPARTTDRNQGNQNQGNQNQMGQNMRVADDVANSVTRLKSVDSATVMVTDSTAYVGVMLAKDYKGKMTSKIEDQVSKQVRKADPSVKRVFVSANPGFVNRLGDYARDVRNGQPISGLVQGFSDLVERTFPKAR
ncbi:YhcN/YlaJ family sporulation lipoprotein [Kroppenstedtia sanguinis]|uniref:YhcN/YlaJ family sporulation lipoprotein n=1 Tax=Kroppenstedtia sanguinis TaxID=1380684 RepID=UPI003D2216DD